MIPYRAAPRFTCTSTMSSAAFLKLFIFTSVFYCVACVMYLLLARVFVTEYGQSFPSQELLFWRIWPLIWPMFELMEFAGHKYHAQQRTVANTACTYH